MATRDRVRALAKRVLRRRFAERDQNLAAGAATKRRPAGFDAGSPAEIKRRIAAAEDPATAQRLARVVGPTLEPVILLDPPGGAASALREAFAAHSAIYAPGSLPVNALRVSLPEWARPVPGGPKLDTRDLENMLWDMLLRDRTARSGKDIILVECRTRGLVPPWRRVKEIWPAARFIHVVRDPAAVAGQLTAEGRFRTRREHGEVSRLFHELVVARQNLPGLTVRYEDLRDQPEPTLRQVAEFIGVDLEPAVVKAFSLPEVASAPVDAKRLPEKLRQAARNWGYA